MSTPPAGGTPDEGRDRPRAGQGPQPTPPAPDAGQPGRGGEQPGWDSGQQPGRGGEQPGWGSGQQPGWGSGQQPGWGGPPQGQQSGWGGPPPQGQWGNDPQTYGYGQVREHAPGAVGALVCGILGLFTIPLILSIIAVVLGNQSKRAAAAEPHRYNDQFGQVGRILGWIGIGLALIGVLILVIVMLAFFPVRAG